MAMKDYNNFQQILNKKNYGQIGIMRKIFIGTKKLFRINPKVKYFRKGFREYIRH